MLNKESKLVKEVNVSKLNIRHRILLSKIPTKTKALILRKLNSALMNPDSSESQKTKVWVDHILIIPFEKLNPIPVKFNSKKSDICNYLTKVKNKLDESVFGLEEPKRELLNYIVQRITNPEAQE